jgi:hypothetical protein
MTATYNKTPAGAADILLNTATGAALVEAANLPGVSTDLLATGQQTPAAGAAVAMSAVTGVKKVVISPLVNADGTPFNTQVVYLRENASNTAAGIPILPTDGKLVLYISDLTQLFVKTLHTGDGINWAAFDG